MKTSKELRIAYKGLESLIEKSFDTITEGKSFDFLKVLLKDYGEPVDEMDQDDMLNVLNENDLQVSLPSIVYYSYNKYKDITGCVIEVSDGLIYVIEDGEGIITDTIRLRNLTLLSRINLINELEDYYKYE